MRRGIEHIRVWLYHHVPAGLLWHPAEWLLAVLCTFSGVVALTTDVRSDSLTRLLPEIPYKIYSALLIVGAFALARGLSSIRWINSDRYVITRVPPYRLGLRLLGLNVGIFIVALFGYAGWGGIMASILPIAFIGMCSLRLIQIGGPDARR
jgi:hypothetical protein